MAIKDFSNFLESRGEISYISDLIKSKTQEILVYSNQYKSNLAIQNTFIRIHSELVEQLEELNFRYNKSFEEFKISERKIIRFFKDVPLANNSITIEIDQEPRHFEYNENDGTIQITFGA